MTKVPLFALACTSLLACMSPALDQGVTQEDPATADAGPESGEPALADAGPAEASEPNLQALVNGADRYRTQLTSDGYLTQVIAVEPQAIAAAPKLANLSGSAESVLGAIQISEPIVFFNKRYDWESLPASMTGIYDENSALREGPVASWLLPNMVSLTEFKSMPACETIDDGITLLPAGNTQFLYQTIDFCTQDGSELSTKCCNPYRYVVEELITNNSEELYFLDQSTVPTLSALENESVKSLFRAALTSHSDFRLTYTDSPKMILDYNPQDLSQICSD